MDKETQRQTLQNVFNELNKINILGSSAEQMFGIKQAVSAVHDALAAEIKEDKKDCVEPVPVNGISSIEELAQ